MTALLSPPSPALPLRFNCPASSNCCALAWTASVSASVPESTRTPKEALALPMAVSVPAAPMVVAAAASVPLRFRNAGAACPSSTSPLSVSAPVSCTALPVAAELPPSTRLALAPGVPMVKFVVMMPSVPGPSASPITALPPSVTSAPASKMALPPPSAVKAVPLMPAACRTSAKSMASETITAPGAAARVSRAALAVEPVNSAVCSSVGAGAKPEIVPAVSMTIGALAFSPARIPLLLAAVSVSPPEVRPASRVLSAAWLAALSVSVGPGVSEPSDKIASPAASVRDRLWEVQSGTRTCRPGSACPTPAPASMLAALKRVPSTKISGAAAASPICPSCSVSVPVSRDARRDRRLQRELHRNCAFIAGDHEGLVGDARQAQPGQAGEDQAVAGLEAGDAAVEILRVVDHDHAAILGEAVGIAPGDRRHAIARLEGEGDGVVERQPLP